MSLCEALAAIFIQDWPREIFEHRLGRENAPTSHPSTDGADAPKPLPWQKSFDGCLTLSLIHI